MPCNVGCGLVRAFEGSAKTRTRQGKRPPLSKGYRIKVNGEAFVVNVPDPTGRAILTLAGLLPAQDYTLRVKLDGTRMGDGASSSPSFRRARSGPTRD